MYIICIGTINNIGKKRERRRVRRVQEIPVINQGAGPITCPLFIKRPVLSEPLLTFSKSNLLLKCTGINEPLRSSGDRFRLICFILFSDGLIGHCSPSVPAHINQLLVLTGCRIKPSLVSGLLLRVRYVPQSALYFSKIVQRFILRVNGQKVK